MSEPRDPLGPEDGLELVETGPGKIRTPGDSYTAGGPLRGQDG
jgi:hypothetical protein